MDNFELSFQQDQRVACSSSIGRLSLTALGRDPGVNPFLLGVIFYDVDKGTCSKVSIDMMLSFQHSTLHWRSFPSTQWSINIWFSTARKWDKHAIITSKGERDPDLGVDDNEVRGDIIGTRCPRQSNGLQIDRGHFCRGTKRLGHTETSSNQVFWHEWQQQPHNFSYQVYHQGQHLTHSGNQWTTSLVAADEGSIFQRRVMRSQSPNPRLQYLLKKSSWMPDGQMPALLEMVDWKLPDIILKTNLSYVLCEENRYGGIGDAS